MTNKITYPNNIIIFGKDRLELRNLAYMLECCSQGHCLSYYDGSRLKDMGTIKEGDKFIIYSPNTCAFVPVEINSLLTKTNALRGNTLIGVFKTNNKFIVNCNNGTNKKYLGTYNTEIEAFEVYKRVKENYIKEVANKWKDFIKPNVYEALINYTVEITD